MAELRDPPGPGMWQSYRRLRHTPLREFPAFLQDIATEYGDVTSFRVPWRRFYFLNDPAAIKEVLVTQQQHFIKSEGTRAMRALLGRGLVTSEEPLHRTMRRMVQPAFHRERIAGYMQTMRDYAEHWNAPDGVFDMHAEMMELTLRIASKTLFGTDEGEEADRVGAALHEVVTIFPDVLGPFGAITRLLPWGPMQRFRRARAVLDTIVMRLIAERRRSCEDRGDALSLLLDLDDDQARDEVMTLFVAGHETTANALTWAWYLLAQHPPVYDRLRAELQENAQTAYPDAVLNEVLRLYPPAWILGRDAQRELDIGGWRIRKGATVLMSQLVLHRSPAYFDQPERFMPERWLDPPALPQFAYFPFGGGSRKCLGDQFAWTEARITLCEIVRRYRFDLATPELPVERDPIITLRPRGAVPMRTFPKVS
jgi:cytochrome P450